MKAVLILASVAVSAVYVFAFALCKAAANGDRQLAESGEVLADGDAG